MDAGGGGAEGFWTGAEEAALTEGSGCRAEESTVWPAPSIVVVRRDEGMVKTVTPMPPLAFGSPAGLVGAAGAAEREGSEEAPADAEGTGAEAAPSAGAIELLSPSIAPCTWPGQTVCMMVALV